MKFFIAISLALVSTCFAADLRRDEKWPPKALLEYLEPIRISCMGKTGVTAEAIKEFSDGELHDDPKLKCYMNCVFNEAKVVDDKGDVHFEKIDTHIAQLDDEIRHIAENFLANCRSIKGDDPCERAFSVHKCWKLHDPKHYFLP
ncbi:hypothetical protein HA402_009519 [Bradysia odoriphaga]|uniref:Odorant-binding protein 8 n=1 Tax=Bradysia odoriphaga TaxID=1564500 RepID=A0A2S0X9G3_9DIPT|nr:odorant-binding protein 8 [Bradysia odoriphaga]KAG4073100.1 hypothetical protein HA402_009519 [Bradysia odoriphaga]